MITLNHAEKEQLNSMTDDALRATVRVFTYQVESKFFIGDRERSRTVLETCKKILETRGSRPVTVYNREAEIRRAISLNWYGCLENVLTIDDVAIACKFNWDCRHALNGFRDCSDKVFAEEIFAEIEAYRASREKTVREYRTA